MSQVSQMETSGFDLFSADRIRKPLYCASCKRSLTGVEVISCAKCNSVDLCIRCFGCGFETESHKPTHPYQIMDNLENISIFNDTWTAAEELVLLDSLEKLGVGNWEEVAARLPRQSAASCERHYMDKCVQGVSRITKSTVGPMEEYSASVIDANLKRAASNLPAIPGSNLAGYLPLRGDFDVEFMNDAEKHVQDIVFNMDDAEDVKARKLEVIRVYNRILDERKLRKEFVLRRGLLNKSANNYYNKTEVERDIRAVLTPFERFVTLGTFDELVKGLVHEHRLKLQIEQLKKYKKQGFNRFSDIRKRVAHDRMLEKAKKARARYDYQLQSSSSRRTKSNLSKKSAETLGEKDPTHKIATSVNVSQLMGNKENKSSSNDLSKVSQTLEQMPSLMKIRKAPQEEDHLVKNLVHGSSPFSTGKLTASEATSKSVENHENRFQSSEFKQLSHGQELPYNSTSVSTLEIPVQPDATPNYSKSSDLRSGKLVPSQAASTASNATQPKPSGVSMSLTEINGTESTGTPQQLNQQQLEIVPESELDICEKQLSIAIGLKPEELSVIKRILQNQMAVNGYLNKERAQQLVRLEMKKFGPIYEFYCKSSTNI